MHTYPATFAGAARRDCVRAGARPGRCWRRFPLPLFAPVPPPILGEAGRFVSPPCREGQQR
eukprot:9588542-Lingulodinium_polyedra.AAC.1